MLEMAESRREKDRSNGLRLLEMKFPTVRDSSHGRTGPLKRLLRDLSPTQMPLRKLTIEPELTFQLMFFRMEGIAWTRNFHKGEEEGVAVMERGEEKGL